MARETDRDKRKSLFLESIVALYLRLNGFFTNGFIVHSPEYGNNLSEVDVLALRLRHNSEPERMVGPDQYLDVSSRYNEVIIGEVKSRGQKLAFNESLRRDVSVLRSILRWSGAIPERLIEGVSNDLHRQIAGFKGSGKLTPTVTCGKIRFRAMIFSPERIAIKRTEPWYVSGGEVVGYLRQCLAPEYERPSCSVQYDIDLWREYSDIVSVIKNHDFESGDLSTRDIYKILSSDDRPTVLSTPRLRGMAL